VLVLFQVGNRKFGLDMPLIKSIHQGSAFFSGQTGENPGVALELDGKEIPLCDLSAILGEGRTSHDLRSKKVMLVESKGNSLALMVDSVDGVVSVESDQIEPLPPIFKGQALACFPRVLRQEENLVLLLSPEGMEGIEWEIQDTNDISVEPDKRNDIQESEEIIDHEVMMQDFENIEGEPESEEIAPSCKPDPAAPQVMANAAGLEEKVPGHETGIVSGIEDEADVAAGEVMHPESSLQEEEGVPVIEERLFEIGDTDKTGEGFEELLQVDMSQPEEIAPSCGPDPAAPQVMANAAGLEETVPGHEAGTVSGMEDEVDVAAGVESPPEATPVEGDAEPGPDGDFFETADIESVAVDVEKVSAEMLPEEEEDTSMANSLLLTDDVDLASNVATPVSLKGVEETLYQTELPQDHEIEHEPRKGSRREAVAAGVAVLVILLLLAVLLWPKGEQEAPALAKSLVSVKNADLGITQKSTGLSQASVPIKTGKIVTGPVRLPTKAGEEILRIENNDFFLSIERSQPSEKKGQKAEGGASAREGEHIYIVVKGDTLWKIARRYLGDPFRHRELSELSRIKDPDLIHPGDVVRIKKK